MNQLELEKAKFEGMFNVRFNPNHASDGKFASGSGSGGSSGGSSGSGGSHYDEDGTFHGSNGYSVTKNGQYYDDKGNRIGLLSGTDEQKAKRKELNQEKEKVDQAKNKEQEEKQKKQQEKIAENNKKYEEQKAKQKKEIDDDIKAFEDKEKNGTLTPKEQQKYEQFKIVQKTNPMTDDYHVGIRKPSDIKTWDEVVKQGSQDGESFSWGDFSEKDAQKALETGKITIYSSKPIGKGGFVSTSKSQSEQYAGGEGNKVYKKTVSLDEVAWINGDEGQYAPVDKKRSDDIMKNSKLERRSYDFDVVAEKTEKGAIITGRPIVYNSRTNIGLFDEIIESRALANTDLTDVRFLVNHDVSKIPLARSRRNNGNSTMKLIPDENGMSIEVLLDVENNSEARSLYSAVKRGDISGMSFLFSVPEGGDTWENFNTDHPTRHVRSIGSVVEVSAVTFPAYESTEIYARSKEALESAKLALENAKRSQKQALESESRSELELAKAKFNALLKVR